MTSFKKKVCFQKATRNDFNSKRETNQAFLTLNLPFSKKGKLTNLGEQKLFLRQNSNKLDILYKHQLFAVSIFVLAS